MFPDGTWLSFDKINTQMNRSLERCWKPDNENLKYSEGGRGDSVPVPLYRRSHDTALKHEFYYEYFKIPHVICLTLI